MKLFVLFVCGVKQNKKKKKNTNMQNMGILWTNFKNATPAPVPETVESRTTEEIPLGVCCHCGLKQSAITSGGFWINGDRKKWACTNCKYDVPIPSYPSACEWCTSTDVQWFQGHTYECQRCKERKIGQYIFQQEISKGLQITT
jgi:hypothetical protein